MHNYVEVTATGSCSGQEEPDGVDGHTDTYFMY